jgi:Lrp/AsnC family transcriptional regulator, leucine-responsive regulatory protein
MNTAEGGDRRRGPRRTKKAARGSMAGLSGAIQRQSPPVSLDIIDRQLLQRLSKDPRISQRQLAREVNMSGPAVGERIARLERLGVIRGYTVSIDWAALGYPLMAYIPMSIEPGADLTSILDELRDVDELEELVVVTGTFDLIARFRLRDHSHLQTLLFEQLWPIYGLQRVETFLSLGTVLDGDALERMLGLDDAAPTVAADPAVTAED